MWEESNLAWMSLRLGLNGALFELVYAIDVPIAVAHIAPTQINIH